jgi:hypothetical protein
MDDRYAYGDRGRSSGSRLDAGIGVPGDDAKPPKRIAAIAPRKVRYFKVLVVTAGIAPASKRAVLVRSAM